MRPSLAAAMAVVASAIAANVATAGTIAVGATCTLPDAVTAANTDTATGGCAAGSGADTIVLEPGAVYTLAAVDNADANGPNGLPAVTSPIAIEGNDATVERSSAPGTPDFRLFSVRRGPAFDGALTLRALTVRGGRVQTVYAADCGGGGAIRARTVELTLDRVTLADNEVAADGVEPCFGGGAIFANGGALAISRSAIVGNRSAAGGGGIQAAGGLLELSDTVVDGNRASDSFVGHGGGLQVQGGNTHIARSTISGNVAAEGGGIWINNEESTIANTTISGNRATGTDDGNSGTAGGIVTYANLELLNSTITGNDAVDATPGPAPAGGVYYGSSFVLRNTIVAGNTVGGSATAARADCGDHDGETLIGDHDLFGAATGCPQGVAANRYVVPAEVFATVLFPLALNDPGTTRTHALVSGSPALDGGDAAVCAAAPVDGVDQRGVVREAACDIGAFERTAVVPPGPGDVVVQVVQGSVAAPPFPGAPITFGLSGLLGEAPVPLELLDLSLTSACSRLIPGDPCRELALSQTVRCQLQPGDPCREASVETACVRFTPGDPCVDGNQAVDLFVELRRHPSGAAAPVLQPAVLANATATAFDVVYDAAVPGIATTRQTLRFAIGAGQPLRFANVDVGAPQSPRFHVTFELERTGGIQTAGPLWTVAPGGTVAPPPPDTTSPELTVPAGIVADATRPAGAAVQYAASASDDQDATPAIACTPPAGAVFPVGTTTVECTATDDAGNTARKTFAVRVRGAGEQLVRLVDKTLAFVDRPALRPELAAPLRAAADGLLARRPATACTALAVYAAAVRLAPPSVLTAAEKSELVADATRIRAVIGCN